MLRFTPNTQRPRRRPSATACLAFATFAPLTDPSRTDPLHPLKKPQEDPVLLITNLTQAASAELADCSARRMVIENQIAETVNLFHMDTLPAAGPMHIDSEVRPTRMARGLYHVLANSIGNRRQAARAGICFRRMDESAAVSASEHAIRVHFGPRARNPVLLNAGFADEPTPLTGLEVRTRSRRFGR